jgi:hypothetical protein
MKDLAPQFVERHTAPNPWSWRKDVPCLLAGILLILCISVSLGYGRIFWEDEMLGWMLVRDPSFHHMVTAWNMGADGGGILFYVTARAWFAVFGPSEMSFRLYSAAGFAAAFAALWIGLRTYYSRSTLAFAIGAIWLLGPQVVIHMCEGRFYGLFMYGAALTFCVTLRLAASTSKKVSFPWLLLNFAANAILIASHLLGLIYSAFLLLPLIVLDIRRRHLRWKLYLSTVLAWCLLLAEYNAIRATLGADKPHFWTSPPTLHHFLGAYHAFDRHIERLMLLLVVALGLCWWRQRSALKNALQCTLRTRIDLYVVAAALALVPIAFAIYSLIGSSIFVDRYLLPITIFPILFTAESVRLLMAVLQFSDPMRFTMTSFAHARLTATGAIGLGLLLWVFVHLRHTIPQRQDYTAVLSAALPKGSFVVLPDGLAYTEIIGRQHDAPVHYHYLLDWKRSIAPTAPRADVSQFHLLTTWQKVGYFAGSIEDQASFIQKHPRFFVVETRFDEEDPTPPGTATVLSTLAKIPGETIQPYPSIVLQGVENKVWLVCQGDCSNQL